MKIKKSMAIWIVAGLAWIPAACGGGNATSPSTTSSTTSSSTIGGVTSSASAASTGSVTGFNGATVGGPLPATGTSSGSSSGSAGGGSSGGSSGSSTTTGNTTTTTTGTTTSVACGVIGVAPTTAPNPPLTINDTGSSVVSSVVLTPDTLVATTPVTDVILYNRNLTNYQAVVQGFGSGTSMGSVNLVGAEGTSGVVVQNSNVLTNPFAGATDGLNLFITSGFLQLGQGKLYEFFAPDLNTGNNSPTAIDLVQAGAAPALINPLDVVMTSPTTLYVSEYAASGAGGGVRKIVITSSTTATVTKFFTSADFPAGLATDGTNLFVCQNLATGSGAGGQVYVIPLSDSDGQTPSSVGAITAPAGQPFNYPFRVRADSAGGIVINQGVFINTLGGTPSFSSSGTTNGAVFYVPSGSTTATTVLQGLGPLAGLSVVDGGNGQDTVAVTEGESQGIVHQISFARATPAPPTQHLLVTGALSYPISATYFPGDGSNAAPDACPSLKIGIFGGGTNNGGVNQYR